MGLVSQVGTGGSVSGGTVVSGGVVSAGGVVPSVSAVRNGCWVGVSGASGASGSVVYMGVGSPRTMEPLAELPVRVRVISSRKAVSRPSLLTPR